MSIIMQTNVASLQAQQNLNRNQSALQTSFNKLSSGFRINSAADDAAGLAISESMKAQIRSYSVATCAMRNSLRFKPKRPSSISPIVSNSVLPRIAYAASIFPTA